MHTGVMRTIVHSSAKAIYMEKLPISEERVMQLYMKLVERMVKTKCHYKMQQQPLIIQQNFCVWNESTI